MIELKSKSMTFIETLQWLKAKCLQTIPLNLRSDQWKSVNDGTDPDKNPHGLLPEQYLQVCVKNSFTPSRKKYFQMFSKYWSRRNFASHHVSIILKSKKSNVLRGSKLQTRHIPSNSYSKQEEIFWSLQ